MGHEREIVLKSEIRNRKSEGRGVSDFRFLISDFPVPPNSLVLDLGCGTGLHTRELANAGYRVVAADIDFDAVSTARELSGDDAIRPLFLVARAEALPFRRETFAAVLCADVLHWAESRATFEAMWQQAWEVLMPRGVFLVHTLLRDHLPDAEALPDGRHRLASGATWFLPALADVEALLAPIGAEPLAVLNTDSPGSVLLLSRKP